jgi:hypothetical protein
VKQRPGGAAASNRDAGASRWRHPTRNRRSDPHHRRTASGHAMEATEPQASRCKIRTTCDAIAKIDVTQTERDPRAAARIVMPPLADAAGSIARTPADGSGTQPGSAQPSAFCRNAFRRSSWCAAASTLRDGEQSGRRPLVAAQTTTRSLHATTLRLSRPTPGAPAPSADGSSSTPRRRIANRRTDCLGAPTPGSSHSPSGRTPHPRDRRCRNQ